MANFSGNLRSRILTKEIKDRDLVGATGFRFADFSNAGNRKPVSQAAANLKKGSQHEAQTITSVSWPLR